METVEKLVVVTDCGFDLDDYYALVWLLSSYDCPTLIISTFWKPEEKASIIRAIVQILKRTNVEVIAGSGIYRGSERYMLEEFPTWPKIFGNPTEEFDESNSYDNYNCVYPHQTKAFKENYPEIFDDPFLNICNYPIIIDKFMSRSKPGEVTVIGIAPFSDVAYIVKNHLLKIKNIITMSGWHGKFTDPTRPNYNVHMDMSSANIIFSQTKVPVYVFSSDFCSVFGMGKEEWDKFLSLDNKFGKTLLSVAKNWEIHRARTSGKKYTSEEEVVTSLPIMHDFITVFCALKHLNKFKSTEIHYALHPENIFMFGNNNPITFLDSGESKESGAEKYLLTVREKPSSNIKLISFNDDDNNQSIINEIYSLMMTDLFTIVSSVSD